MKAASGYKLQATETAGTNSRRRAHVVPAACSLKPVARRSGFALLVVLVVLVLAGTVLAATVRRSGREALMAASEMERLQVKWAMCSSRAVGQTSAEGWLLEDADDETLTDDDAPPTSARRAVTLGNVTVTMVATDEEARANANLLAARGGAQGLVSGLRRLMSECRSAVRIELSPMTPRAEIISAVPRLYQSYAQLFPDARPTDLLGGAAGEEDDAAILASSPGAADAITCWGSGRVNFRRASRDVLRQTLAGLADEGQVDKLISYRLSVPGGSVAEAVAQLELDDQDKATALAKAMTDASHCHGLWVVVRGSTRSWTQLTVKQEGDVENDSGEWAFRW